MNNTIPMSMNMMDLPAIKIGKKLVKFLFYRPPDLFYFGTEGKEPSDFPLFLGSDVLAGSSVLQKNYARVHARYGKDGFASRLKLNGIAIEGIPNSTALWFYTVQGVFKATFEYLGLDVQRHCLTLLTDTWLSTCDMPSAAEHMELQVLREELVDCASSSENIEIDHLSVAPLNTIHDGRVAFTVDESESGNEMSLSKNADSGHRDIEVSERVTDQSQNSGDGFLQLLDSLKKCIGNHQLTKSSRGSSYTDNLMTALKLIRMEYSDGETDSAIPFSIIEQYCQLLNGDRSSNELANFGNDFGISVKTNVALCLFCEWIGKVFNSLTPVIAGKAEAFKLENIDRVHNLPKAESLIDILFPQSMKILLLHWMSSPNSIASKHDHTYSPPQKKIKEESLFFKKPVFPFIQIILEFANSALVSGVAHVLHTRLLHDNS